jgi:hypothetical protein|tara:strand:+ start:14431 stop:14877 length:447 start_codon:yes stop_codon:yes gene_type:complete
MGVYKITTLTGARVYVKPPLILTKGANMWDEIEYFRPHEFECQHCGEDGINIDLVKKLDELRKLYALPIKSNSAYRCPDHPLSITRPTSSHIKGLACDISAKSSRERYTLLQLILNNNLFDRIGISDKDGFIHVDIDKDKSGQLVWVY